MKPHDVATLGPLMIDLAGLAPSAEELQRLQDPRVGGLILFSRNFSTLDQLSELIAHVRQVRPQILVAVDHEGGRVQRFRQGFTRLPAMRQLGAWYDRDPKSALAAAHDIAYVLAAELRAAGVDVSFTPVLDLDWGRSAVIGDRSLHRDPDAVCALAGALIDGLHAAGMAACGKHFPGHGWVEADSHLAIPYDERGLSALEEDMRPYRKLPLDAVMPAHVIYPKVDPQPAGFSPCWHQILRQDIGFSGVVFSDDLSMEGASVAGGVLERVEAAYAAGCDMLLLCNAPEQVKAVLAHWHPPHDPVRAARIMTLAQQGKGGGAPGSLSQLQTDACWQRGVAACAELLTPGTHPA